MINFLGVVVAGGISRLSNPLSVRITLRGSSVQISTIPLNECVAPTNCWRIPATPGRATMVTGQNPDILIFHTNSLQNGCSSPGSDCHVGIDASPNHETWFQ